MPRKFGLALSRWWYDTRITMPSTNVNDLESELKYFEAHRAELVRSARGRYALVKGEQLGGIYEDRDEAIRAGYEKFGNESFLVKEILEVDIPLNFTSFNLGV